jgi:hypothetical protein
MTPFTVLAALALFTFAPSSPSGTSKATTATKSKDSGAPAAGTPGAVDPASSPRVVTPPEHGPQGTDSYAALVRCQNTCDETKTTANMERASCKLVCLKTFPSVARKYTFVPKPGDTRSSPRRQITQPEATRETPPPRPGDTQSSPRRQITPPETTEATPPPKPGETRSTPRRQTTPQD